jgi:hypothetical protein
VYKIVLAAVLVLAASAVALDTPDVPGGVHSGPRVAYQADRDQARSQTQAAPTPVSVMLEQMSPAERENSRISVEFGSSDAELLALGREVERLWNAGQYDEAVVRLGSLEARVGIGCVAIGNSWREPVPTLETDFWETDVRIGNRDSLLDLSFDTQLSSGNLFVVLRSGAGSEFSVCISTDGGVSWNETYLWTGYTVLPSLDAAVLANHLYVAYCDPADEPQHVRLRRFKCTDGSSDTFNTGDQFVVACTLDVGDTLGEVSIVSSQHSFNDRLYITTLVTDGGVAYCWADTGAVSWTRVATGITSGALRGLDATENQGFDSTFLFISYYDATDSLRIYGRSTNGNWTPRYSRYTGPGDLTSISAYGDTIICAFDDATAAPLQVSYMINYGDGATWTQGTLSHVDTTAEAPGITARGGGGLAAVFRHYTLPRELRFRWRIYQGPGAWSDPISIADVDPYWNRPGIEYLGSGVYGVVFLSRSPVVYGAYFDRSDWPGGLAEQRRLIVDENILSVTPNPFSGSGRLNYTLNRPADLHVQVYDRAGRVVRTLFDGRSPAGKQSLGFDAAGMVPGVYFVRADAGGRVLTVPVTVVK